MWYNYFRMQQLNVVIYQKILTEKYRNGTDNLTFMWKRNIKQKARISFQFTNSSCLSLPLSSPPPPPHTPCKPHPFPQSTSVAISSRRLVACSADRVSFRSRPRSTVRSAITTATSSSIWLHPWKNRQLSHLIFPFPLKHIEK